MSISTTMNMPTSTDKTRSEAVMTQPGRGHACVFLPGILRRIKSRSERYDKKKKYIYQDSQNHFYGM